MTFNWIDYLTLNNIGFAIGVVSLVFAIYTYLKTRERRALAYKRAESEIVGGNGPSLLDGKIEIRFSGRVIERVTKTTFWVWNAGNRTVDADDIAQSDPVRFVVPDGCEVLEASVVSVSSGANDVGLKEITTTAIRPGFEFLDPKQGFKVEILHTSPKGAFAISGTLKGIGGPRPFEADSLYAVMAVIAQMLLIGIVNILVGLGIGILLASLVPTEYKLIQAGLIMIPLGLFALGGFVVRDIVADRFAKRRPPGSLDF